MTRSDCIVVYMWFRRAFVTGPAPGLFQMTICKNIVKANLVFPEYVTDPGAKDLIRLLLTK